MPPRKPADYDDDQTPQPAAVAPVYVQVPPFPPVPDNSETLHEIRDSLTRLETSIGGLADRLVSIIDKPHGGGLFGGDGRDERQNPGTPVEIATPDAKVVVTPTDDDDEDDGGDVETAEVDCPSCHETFLVLGRAVEVVRCPGCNARLKLSDADWDEKDDKRDDDRRGKSRRKGDDDRREERENPTRLLGVLNIGRRDKDKRR